MSASGTGKGGLVPDVCGSTHSLLILPFPPCESLGEAPMSTFLRHRRAAHALTWFFLGTMCPLSLMAQGRGAPPPAPATTPQFAQSLFKDLRWRNIGPANIAGRVTDIEAVESNPAVVIVAAASGGMFK